MPEIPEHLNCRCAIRYPVGGYPYLPEAATATVILGYTISQRRKKELGMLAGLQFFHRNNTGGYQIVSRHWPHLLCWSWTFGWHPYRKGFDGARRIGLQGSRHYMFFELYILIGKFRLSWQQCDWMLRDKSNMQMEFTND